MGVQSQLTSPAFTTDLSSIDKLTKISFYPAASQAFNPLTAHVRRCWRQQIVGLLMWTMVCLTALFLNRPKKGLRHNRPQHSYT